ncbi:MAG: DUF3105 domain-containing protein [Solirubrobacteraceae bacterium]|nr:DUF3105 domain-containing protein [Solirubrobacteraceae bacterium]
MSSRQEEKEQRKQERLEREAKAAKAAKRKRLLQLIGGVIVAGAVVAGIAFAVSSAGNGTSESAGGADVDTGRLTSAASDAGCVYRAFPNEGEEHTAEPLTAEDFETNPPTSGTHNPNPAPDGLYVTGNEPAIENWVHTLEHGRVLFQYKPGTDEAVVSQLEALFNEDVAGSGGGYHSVLMQNNTDMPFEVAAVAWRHYMACETFTPRTIEALRVFRDELVDKGPETVP